MNKAIFFDRDGTINHVTDKYYISKAEDFIINEGVIGSLKILQQHNFIFIIISNQSGIAKNLYSIDDAESIHNLFLDTLKNENIKIAEIYFCPHHPEYSGKCLCRKPDSLLIEKALGRFQIDPAKSYFIGDALRDVQAAEKAGVQGILIQQNENFLQLCKTNIIG